MTRRLLFAATALIAVLGAAVPVGATPAREPREAAAAAPELEVIAQNLEVAPDGSFNLWLRVRGAPADGDLFVGIYDPIADARDLVASTTDSPTGLRATFEPQSLDGEPGSTIETGISISLYARGLPRPSGAWAYRLDEPGVYPIRVRLRDRSGEVVDSLVTYLVRTPADASGVVPASVALLTDVHLAAQTVGTASPAPAPAGFVGDVTGVLDRFRSHRDLPASFQVTPETLVRLQADDAGARVVESLETELGRDRRDLLGAPYVDLDPARLQANGLNEEITRQAQLGEKTLTSVLGRETSDTWLVDHHVDVATVEALKDLGVAHLVLPPTSVSNLQSAQPVLLPGAAGVTAVTSSVFELRGPGADDPVLAGYQLLGRLAAVSTLTPNGAGVVVRIDPRSVDPVALDTVLDTLDAPAVYLRPTNVAELFRTVPTTTTPIAALSPASTASLGDYPNDLRVTNQLVASYGSMFDDPAATEARFDPQIAVSAEDRLTEPQRRRILARVRRQIEQELRSVSLPARDHITLGARDAVFPVPISSKIDRPLKVLVTLEASDRLEFPDEQIAVTLENERTNVEVPVRTRATGDTPLRITVRTPDGAVTLAEAQYTVRSTAVSGVGLLLTIGAAAFLALWWGRHWYRTRKQARQAPPDTADDPDDSPPPPAGGGADDDIFVASPM